jgi:type I restriction enzyme S subunit
MTAHGAVLPSGWTSATVGDLGEFINGLAFKPSDWEDSGRPIIRIQNLTGRNEAFNLTTRVVSDDFIVSAGDVLVSWSATLDVFVWRGPVAVLNQHIFKVVPARSMTDHVFVHWALKNAIEEMWVSEHTHGTTMRHINRGPFLAHSLLLPPSGEQTRIADVLESYLSRLDAAVATLEAAQTKLKAYRASVLKAAVEGRLVPTEAALARAEKRDFEPADVLLKRILSERWRRWEQAQLAKLKAAGKSPKDEKWKAKYEEPKAPDTKGLPGLPEGWCWTSVNMIADVKGGVTKGQRRGRDQELVEVPYLRVANVQRGYLDLGEVKTIAATPAEVEELCLEAGDVLFNEGGDRDKLGRGWVWGGEIPTCIHQNHVFRARIVSPDLRPRFLSWYGNSSGQRYFFDEGKQTTNLASINMTKLKALPVPLPPLAEQDRIAEEVERLLSIADEMDGVVAQDVRRCQRLRQSILKWAFEGKLVDQDPTDEPAEKLLERIRAERANTETPKRTRRARAAP